jgi:hypothetical protein
MFQMFQVISTLDRFPGAVAVFFSQCGTRLWILRHTLFSGFSEVLGSGGPEDLGGVFGEVIWVTVPRFAI